MNKKTVKKRLVLKTSVSIFLSKLLITVIIFLIGLILVKQNPAIKKCVKENIYEKSFKFTKIKQLYKNYFGNLIPLDNLISKTQPVFNERLTYTSVDAYKEGAQLIVNNNYMVPNLETGIVVFIGEKEGYGQSIIIEQIDGIEVLYSNITPNNLKLYDYIEKGKLLGEVNTDKLYLVFYKDGAYLNYKDYI